MRKTVAVLLAAVLAAGLWGCSFDTVGRQFDRAWDAAQDGLERAEAAVQTGNVTGPTQSTGELLTPQQAETIALEHAGFTADQVSYLRTDYELDDGIPQYEVRFHQGPWEYDYEINARTGQILSYDRDD